MSDYWGDEEQPVCPILERSMAEFTIFFVWVVKMISRLLALRINIVFVWSQYDGGNIDKEQWLRFPPKPNEAKLNIMGGDLFWILTSNILIQSFTI